MIENVFFDRSEGFLFEATFLIEVMLFCVWAILWVGHLCLYYSIKKEVASNKKKYFQLKKSLQSKKNFFNHRKKFLNAKKIFETQKIAFEHFF